MSVMELSTIYRKSVFFGNVGSQAVRFMLDFTGENGKTAAEEMKEFLVNLCERYSIQPTEKRTNAH